MLSLILAAAAWIAVHVGIAGTSVRRASVSRLGEVGFRALFSVLSVVTISALVSSYVRVIKADPVWLWNVPAWIGWLLVAIMALAFVLFVASVTSPNPTAVGGERVLGQEARGIGRVTRHPMLWSFALWSIVHVVGNGNLASLFFFGAFGVTALVGMPSIDRKLAARDPVDWSRFAKATSIVPFAAIAAGRNRFALREIGILPFALGFLVWIVLLVLHPRIFGVSPLPS